VRAQESAAFRPGNERVAPSLLTHSPASALARRADGLTATTYPSSVTPARTTPGNLTATGRYFCTGAPEGGAW
jgi:hypothetical protein